MVERMPEIRLGEARVHTETGKIRSKKGEAHLEPKSMAVLHFLVERHGKVVSREELLDAVWPGIHVGDDSLTAAIIKIRRALGDDARNPAYIETIPKRGYRLIPAVEVSANAASGSSEAVGEPGLVRSGHKILRVLTAVLAVLGVALYLVLPLSNPAEQKQSTVNAQAVIKVMPFANVSGDPEQDYLALGISDTVLNDLAHQSEFAVRQVLESGDALSPPPDYILQGSIAHIGDRLRVVARLLDGGDGEVLKALQFDRPFDELLAIEDEIRKNLLSEISYSIIEEERSRRARGYTENVTAYDFFLRGQSQLLVRTAATNSRARELFRTAIAADEAFARAYGGLALSYAAEYRNGWDDDGQAALENALKFAQTAIGISPDLPEQHWVIGYVQTQQRQYTVAETHLNRAIKISPGFADAYALLGGIATYRENPEDTIPLLREALRINPSAGYLYFLLLARAYYFLGDYEQAHINLSEALNRNPENLESHLYLAATLLNLDRADEAEWEAMEVLGLDPNFSLGVWSETYPMNQGVQLDRFLADLRLVGFS
ncbi:winged helix-turn-helix domain-containing protein [Pacificibacter sp.]|uniref:winged helix-turn-helix domain-containing tetratricopeptide repeat protein n=1 Tax=Pacificibacter sp. TaxID=1917866 RepID=UPI00321C19F4